MDAAAIAFFQFFWDPNRDWRINLFATGTFVAFLLFWFGAGEDRSREALANWVRRGGWKRLYESALHHILKTTDRWFLTVQEYDGLNALPLLSRSRAWSATLYGRTLFLAVLYPILFVIVQWAITGNAGKIGSLEIIPAYIDDFSRIAAFSGFTASLGCSFIAVSRIGTWSRIIWIALGLLLSLTPIAVSLVAFAFAFAISFAVLLCYAASQRFATDGVFVFAGAYTIAIAFAFGDIFDFLGALEGFAAIALTALWAVGGLFAIPRMQDGQRDSWGVFAYLIWLGIGLLIATSLGGPYSSSDASLLIMIAALPLANALFDFASIGVTRYALRHGVRRVSYWTVLASIADLIAAAILFLALGCSIVAIIQILNSVAVAPLLHLGPSAPGASDGLFAQIADRPQDYWWLYATFFSTLLPTAIHLLIALFAIGPALLIAGGRVWLARWTEESGDHFYKRLVATGILAIWAGISLTAMAVIPHQIFVQLTDDPASWGLAFLGGFEWFYCRLPGASCG